jgi:hypothetical protein
MISLSEKNEKALSNSSTNNYRSKSDLTVDVPGKRRLIRPVTSCVFRKEE